MKTTMTTCKFIRLYNLYFSEECIYPESPFSRKILFFYYTLMMDEIDLKQTDPKRSGLEQDRIILEFAVNKLRSHLNEIRETAKELYELYNMENYYFKKQVYLYKAQQINLLKRIITEYEETYYRIIKEDSL